MAILYRRTDIAVRDSLSRAVRRTVTQAARDAGDGAASGASWGSISGTIDNQADLKERLDDLEILAVLDET